MRLWLTTRFWPRLYRALTKWQQDDGLTWAASLAYYGAFSFFPLVLVMVSAAGLILRVSPNAQIKQDAFVDLIHNQVSAELADQVQRVLGHVKSNAAINGPIGIGALLLAAIGIFVQLEAAFDRIWKVNELRPAPRGVLAVLYNVLITRLRAFLMLIATGAIVVVGFVVNMVVSTISKFAESVPLGDFFFHALQIGISAFLNGLMFTLLYAILPKRRVQWKQAVAGGLVAGIAWEIGRQVLALLIVSRTYTAYGIIGSFIFMMLWIYYASIVLLIGAEFVEVGDPLEPLKNTVAADTARRIVQPAAGSQSPTRSPDVAMEEAETPGAAH